MGGGQGRECTRLHSSYGEMRGEATQQRFVALMEAFEGDLRDGAFAFLPVADENVASMHGGGPIKWLVLPTPKGKMLALFTSREEVSRHPAGNSVGVSLAAFVRMALEDGSIAGILLNPLDGHRGIPVDRANLAILASRSGLVRPQMPQIHPGVVSNAVYRLWEIAVGVPTPVYDVSAEVKSLGGLEKTLAPLLQKWEQSLKDGTFKPSGPLDYVNAVLKDVVAAGFVYGAMALKHPDKALDVDIDKCIDGIPGLRDDIGQNVDEYLVLLSDAIRSDLVEQNEGHVQTLLAANVGIIAFGAFSFGVGWGIAKDAQSRGVMALADLRDKQQQWLEEFKANVLKHVNEQGEGKADEDGK